MFKVNLYRSDEHHVEIFIENLNTGDQRWFCGDEMRTWSMGCNLSVQPFLRNHASRICRAEWLFDSLSERQQCELKAWNQSIVADDDVNFDVINEIWELSVKRDKEIIKIIKV